jgi:hypothetical protein
LVGVNQVPDPAAMVRGIVSRANAATEDPDVDATTVLERAHEELRALLDGPEA